MSAVAPLPLEALLETHREAHADASTSQGAVRVVADPSQADREAALARLRQDLVHRFPGAVIPGASSIEALTRPRQEKRRSALHDAPFAWVEVGLGEGGLAWLAAWTVLRLAADPLGRPALWVDTHGTYCPGDLLDLGGRLVVVRPDDPHEAHVAADIALRSGSFCLVALEMHRALHPKPLGRLARLSHGEGLHAGNSQAPRPRLVVWGAPPAFVAPPSGVPRTSFAEAIVALSEATFGELADPRELLHDGDRPDTLPRAPHTTDRLRPLDHAADRRAPPSFATPTGSPMVLADARGPASSRAVATPFGSGAR